MLTFKQKKQLLQVCVGLACLVPLTAGLSGILMGVAMLSPGNLNVDSHFRYLSGLLLGIGIGFASCIPSIERQGQTVKLLTFVVLVGGVGRLIGVLITGWPNISMQLALVMELIVTPALYLWQRRIGQSSSNLQS